MFDILGDVLYGNKEVEFKNEKYVIIKQVVGGDFLAVKVESEYPKQTYLLPQEVEKQLYQPMV